VVVCGIGWVEDGVEDLELETLGLMRLEGNLLLVPPSPQRSLRV
jgi:hypothetical protein